MARRPGLSLFEVLLAIAILGGSLVAIGELLRTGSRAAVDARELTTAQLLAETKMAEIASGIIPAQPVSQQQDPDYPDWTYSIQVEQPSQQGLLMVSITFEQPSQPAANSRVRPRTFTLVRWMVDPSVDLALPTTDGTTGTTSSSTTGGSTSGGGTTP